MKKDRPESRISLSVMMTCVVIGLVLTVLGSVLIFFIDFYQSSMEQNAAITSEQAVVQVMNMVEDYTAGMADSMRLISAHMGKPEEERDEFFQSFMEIRPDVVAVTTYRTEGELLNCWSNGLKRKSSILQNLSYMEEPEGKGLRISKPHVETLFEEYYPWVVTICQNMKDGGGEELQVFMDIRFSNIASYVDDVGIGQHGYCFIQDTEGNLIYHPQQQLIYSGLKEEMTGELKSLPDGSHTRSNVIYTIHTLENCNWRVVGVSYVDELITGRVEGMVRICVILLLLVLVTAVLVGILFSRLFAMPAKRLTGAMEAFEQEAENFQFVTVRGASEISALSDSFGHMVVRIQELMEQVRQEEITLRKTELNALQAQINPHFLYNTLDSIAWMCEEDRTKEAVEMVNALARLFRISISRGHELITLEREVEHAKSYLKIQNYRYKNQFTYEFDVEESCLSYLCNKITLQPIIENAIYHGIDRMVEEGCIQIRIEEEETAIRMTVTDNGVGMSEEQCKEILHREAGERTGIGIKNVNDRIRIYFGEEYGLHITSELDEGTCVEIRIPKLTELE
ncbi:sensor histidine kinase [Candidatus Merdisoma sp. JLR.KK006]|uniref:cache domain-containing sensor histidine kinase n=1 Tax=Candidatus Merdisoma sp. JLR.KK006 TaxID=3112626 RepID=UPI002FEE7D41